MLFLATRATSSNPCHFSKNCYFLQHILFLATCVTFCNTLYFLQHVLLFLACWWKYQLTKYLWNILDIPRRSVVSAVFVLCLVTAVGPYTVAWERSQDGGVRLVSAFSRCLGGTTKTRFFVAVHYRMTHLNNGVNSGQEDSKEVLRTKRDIVHNEFYTEG